MVDSPPTRETWASVTPATVSGDDDIPDGVDDEPLQPVIETSKITRSPTLDRRFIVRAGIVDGA
jgi:hypothetical protein